MWAINPKRDCIHISRSRKRVVRNFSPIAKCRVIARQLRSTMAADFGMFRNPDTERQGRLHDRYLQFLSPDNRRRPLGNGLRLYARCVEPGSLSRRAGHRYRQSPFERRADRKEPLPTRRGRSRVEESARLSAWPVRKPNRAGTFPRVGDLLAHLPLPFAFGDRHVEEADHHLLVRLIAPANSRRWIGIREICL